MKKTVLSLISLALVAVMLFAFAACSSGPYNGKYYTVSSSGEVNQNGYFKISGSKWSIVSGGESYGGACEINEETGEIIMKYTLVGDRSLDPVKGEAGEEVVLFKGVIGDGVLTLTSSKVSGFRRTTFYRDGKIPTPEGIDANSLANAMSSALADYGWD